MYTRNKMHLLHQAHFTLIRTRTLICTRNKKQNAFAAEAHLSVHTKQKQNAFTTFYNINRQVYLLYERMSRAVSAGKYCVETVPSNHVPSNHVPITRWREKRKSDAFLCEPPSCQVSLATKYL